MGWRGEKVAFSVDSRMRAILLVQTLRMFVSTCVDGGECEGGEEQIGGRGVDVTRRALTSLALKPFAINNIVCKPLRRV